MSEKGRRVNPSSLAADLVADARRIQRESGKQINGPLGLDRTELSRISATAKILPLIRSMPSPLADATLALLERFEELCRRRAVDIPDRLHEPVYEHLARELSTNHQALGGNARHLVAVTLHHGNVSDLMTDPEFAPWQKVSSLLRHAVRRHPSDPWGFLRQAEKTFVQLMADPELTIWKNSPGAVRRTVIMRPQAPRKHLLQAVRIARELESDPKFELWRDSPGVYHRMAIDHPADPRGYLLRVTELVHHLTNDPELAFWHNSPWVYKRAALNHPDCARSKLLQAAASARDIQREVADTDLGLKTSRIRYAALTNPASARQALQRKESRQNIKMFAASEPSDEASGKRYLAELRQLQRQTTAGLGGSSPLAQHDHRCITEGLAVSKGCRKLPKNVSEPLTRLLEVMAIRRKLPIPAVLRGAIYDILARDFQTNLTTYGGNPAKLVSVTLYHGDVSGLLNKPEFATFADTPYIIRSAVWNSPRDPAEFLRRAIREIERLKSDPRFACFLATPGVFHQAVIGHTKHPERYLQEVADIVRRMEDNPLFAEFRKTSHLFLYVATRYRKSSEAFLERVLQIIRRLQADPRFVRFQNTPWVFRRVALSCPSHPEKTLGKAAKTIEQLQKDKRFSEFADNPGILTDVAFRYSSNPGQFLHQAQEVIAQLKKDSRLKRFQTYPWAYVYAATRYRLGAAEALLRVAKQIDRLTADPRLVLLRNCPSIFTRTALYRPHTCEALLLQAVHDPALREKLIDGNAQAGEDEDNEP